MILFSVNRGSTSSRGVWFTNRLDLRHQADITILLLHCGELRKQSLFGGYRQRQRQRNVDILLRVLPYSSSSRWYNQCYGRFEALAPRRRRTWKELTTTPSCMYVLVDCSVLLQFAGENYCSTCCSRQTYLSALSGSPRPGDAPPTTYENIYR